MLMVNILTLIRGDFTGFIILLLKKKVMSNGMGMHLNGLEKDIIQPIETIL